MLGLGVQVCIVGVLGGSVELVVLTLGSGWCSKGNV